MTYKYFLIVCTILSTGFAVRRIPNSVAIGDFIYQNDPTTTRTREEAVAFCEGYGGQLAKIHNTTLYNVLSRAVRQTGTYWIDGTDWPGINRFVLNYTTSTCSNQYSYWNFEGMPENSLEVDPISCLTLVKGRTQATSKIAVANCKEENLVLCQYPLDECSSNSSQQQR